MHCSNHDQKTCHIVEVVRTKGTYLSSACLDAAELADNESGTGFELLGTSVELSGAGSEVGSWHGCTDGWGSEEGQGGDGSGGDGGEMHLYLGGAWKTGVLKFGNLVV